MKVYVASRASLPARPAMWLDRLAKDDWNIVSTWIHEAGPGETANFGELWSRIQREIAVSDVLILYAETEDFPLKGAYVEVGLALGMHKPVAVVLPGVELSGDTSKPVGSWIEHPGVRVFRDLDQAYQVLHAEWALNYVGA